MMRTTTSARVASNGRRLMLACAIGIALIAACVRLWQLDARPLGADESVAALITRQLALGGGYEHFPGVHGPVQFFAGAFAFRTLGIDDTAARLMPAVFGVLLALLPLALMRQLGRAGAIAAALMLAVSPSLVVYSRYAGPEIYLAFFSLAFAVMLWRYLDRGERAYLYVMTAVLALMFATSEMALVIAPIFVAFLAYATAVDLFGQMSASADAGDQRHTHYELLGVAEDAPAKQMRIAYRALADATEDRAAREELAHAFGVLTNQRRRVAYDRRLAVRRANDAPVGAPGLRDKIFLLVAAWPIAAAWGFIRGWRERRGLREMPVAASPMLLVSLLALPFYGPIVQKLSFVGDRGFEGQQAIYVIGGVTREPGGESAVMLTTLGALFAIAGVIGLAWRAHVWIICWATFYGIAITLFTGFFTNSGGAWTGLWGTLDYWWRPEAEVNREPVQYYGNLLSMYELAPLAIIACGVIVMVVVGTMRDRMAIACAAVAVALAMVVPESAPVAGAYRVEFAGIVALSAVLLLRVDVATKFFAFWAAGAVVAFSVIDQKQPWLLVHASMPAILLAGCVVGRAWSSARVPALLRDMPFASPGARRGFVAAGAAAACVMAFVVTMRVEGDADADVSALRPESTAPELLVTLEAIERAGAMSGQKTDVPIALDTSREFATPWLWYLRDYANLQLVNMQRDFEAAPGTIVLADARNGERVNADMSVAATYAHMQALEAPADAWTFGGRAADAATVSGNDGVAYFPGLLAAALPSELRSDVLGSGVQP